MRLSFFQVDPSDTDMVDLSLTFLGEVTSHPIARDKLLVRMQKELRIPSAGPLANPDRSMFEVWIGVDLDDLRKEKVAVFLDRTLDRPNPLNANSPPRRDWWCISLGLDSSITVADAAAIYSELKIWIKSQIRIKGRMFAIVWEEASSLDRTQPTDEIFYELQKDIENPRPGAWIHDVHGNNYSTVASVPREKKYGHFGDPADYLKMAYLQF